MEDRRSISALTGLLNTPSGRSKLVASLMASALCSGFDPAQASIRAMDEHGFDLGRDVRLGLEAALRLDALIHTPMPKGLRQRMDAALEHDSFALALARQLADAQLEETSEGLHFDAGWLSHQVSSLLLEFNLGPRGRSRDARP